MQPSTFRADISTGLYQIISAFRLANPTLLKGTYPAEPMTLNLDLPAAWVEMGPETVKFDSGIRDRTMRPAIVVVVRWTTNDQSQATIDPLVDALLDHLTLYPSIIPGTIWDEMTITPDVERDGDAVEVSVRFEFGDVSIQEGRQ